MTTILSLDEETNLLKTQTISFVTKHGLPELMLTEYDWQNLMFVMLDDELSTRFKWSAPSHRFEAALERVLTWFASNGADPHSAQYMTLVLDELHQRLNTLVGRLIPVKTWDVWCIRLIGDSVMLTQGDDFRLLEWQRLVDTGVLVDPLKRL